VRERVREGIPWVVTALCAFGIAYHQQLFSWNTAAASGPARDVALPGGGVSDGSHCGTKDYHYFPVSTVTDTGGMLPGTPTGPAAVLSSYGNSIQPHGGGYFTIDFSLAAGSPTRSFTLSAPLGAQGVAVEIEGPNGLVGGAHNLPVTLDDDSARQPDGAIRVGAPYGLTASLKLPAEILCPGYDVAGVGKGLDFPTDSQSTITGPPPYTLTVSISDPNVTALRQEIGSTAIGPVLAADNLEH